MKNYAIRTCAPTSVFVPPARSIRVTHESDGVGGVAAHVEDGAILPPPVLCDAAGQCQPVIGGQVGRRAGHCQEVVLALVGTCELHEPLQGSSRGVAPTSTKCDVCSV